MHGSGELVTRGAERDRWAPLGRWELGRPPQLRDPNVTRRTVNLSSLFALLAAAAIAVGAVFVTRGGGALPAAPDAAPASVSAAAPPTVAPPPASLDAAPRSEPPPGAAPRAAAAETSAPQPNIDQAAMENAAPNVQRAAVLANTPKAERQIRTYLDLPASQTLPLSFHYTVEPGDTVGKIAARFGLEEATIRFNNFEIYDPDLLEIGSTIQLPIRNGVIYVVQSGDTLEAVLKKYEADLEATLDFAGNEIFSKDQIWVGQKLLLVGGSASVASYGFSGSGAWVEPTFRWPMAVKSISDPFGTPRSNSYGYHTGVDWPAPDGTIVGATAPGVVSYAGWDASYGNWVEVDHGGGMRSRYAHLREIFVSVGEELGAGAFVGAVGSTGNSSGAHLHFEIINQGQPVNPYIWLE